MAFWRRAEKLIPLASAARFSQEGRVKVFFAAFPSIASLTRGIMAEIMTVLSPASRSISDRRDGLG